MRPPDCSCSRTHCSCSAWFDDSANDPVASSSSVTADVGIAKSERPQRRFLVGECPVLAAASPPLTELGLQWAGEVCLAPEDPIGEYTGLVLAETEEEDYEHALRALLLRFGGLAPTRYCLALRRVGAAGWRLVDDELEGAAIPIVQLQDAAFDRPRRRSSKRPGKREGSGSVVIL